MGEEALTEDAQSVLENGLKSIILGEDADASPFSEEAMYSALLGALSAGILNGPQAALEAGRTVSVGNSFIKNGKIGDAIKLGLSNVKSSEEYQTAAKMATEMTEGKNPSAYQLGALVIQSMSDTATTRRCGRAHATPAFRTMSPRRSRRSRCGFRKKSVSCRPMLLFCRRTAATAV